MISNPNPIRDLVGMQVTALLYELARLVMALKGFREHAIVSINDNSRKKKTRRLRPTTEVSAFGLDAAYYSPSSETRPLNAKGKLQILHSSSYLQI